MTQRARLKPDMLAGGRDNLRAFEYVEPADGIASNLLIMFHGLGDTQENFAKLAKRMRLPQTAALAVRAPFPLPLDMGWCWHESFEQDGSLIEYVPGEKRRLASLARTREMVLDLLDVLQNKCGWKPGEIFLFGFSQGAMAALDAALASPRPLGGVVCISLNILQEWMDERKHRKTPAPEVAASRETPVLLTHGALDDVVDIDTVREAVAQLKAEGSVRSADLNEFSKEHGMISSEAEMRVVMAFFSKNLKLRSAALDKMEGLVEVAPGKASVTREPRR
eukprot:tig00000441_g720.t1